MSLGEHTSGDDSGHLSRAHHHHDSLLNPASILGVVSLASTCWVTSSDIGQVEIVVGARGRPGKVQTYNQRPTTIYAARRPKRLVAVLNMVTCLQTDAMMTIEKTGEVLRKASGKR